MSNNGRSEKFPDQNKILLMKLSDAYDSAPPLEGEYVVKEYSKVQQWVARTGALISRVDKVKGIYFRNIGTYLKSSWNNNLTEMYQILLDTTEDLRLELELNGRAEIGKIYESGKEYSFYSDLRGILGKATEEIFIVDPYFDVTAFQAYFDEASQVPKIRILCNKYAPSIAECVTRFRSQTSVQVDAKKYGHLHDRVIFIDKTDGWIVGASIKDGGKKPTYLIPLPPQLSPEKLTVYENAWGQAVSLTTIP